MQAVFKEITAGDIDAVRQRLARTPDAVALIASSTPKKHAGQSPLMVAFTTGQFDIAGLLLDHGADVDFVDSGSAYPYSRPVLHDAIKAAVLRARPRRPQHRGPVDVAAVSFATLHRMIESGADIHAVDSYGNSSLHRAALDATQMLPSRSSDEPVDEEFAGNLHRIFDLLCSHGADPHRTEPTLGKSVADHYGASPVARFLRSDTAQ